MTVTSFHSPVCFTLLTSRIKKPSNRSYVNRDSEKTKYSKGAKKISRT